MAIRLVGPWLTQTFSWPHGWSPTFLLYFTFKFVWLTYVKGCQMRFGKIPAILSTAPDLSYVVIRKPHRENRETISIVKPQLIICPILAYSLHFGMCDVTIAPRIGSTAANKLHWRNCHDKIHYKSRYNLRNSTSQFLQRSLFCCGILSITIDVWSRQTCFFLHLFWLFLKDLGFNYNNFSLAFSTNHNHNNKNRAD